MKNYKHSHIATSPLILRALALLMLALAPIAAHAQDATAAPADPAPATTEPAPTPPAAVGDPPAVSEPAAEPPAVPPPTYPQASDPERAQPHESERAPEPVRTGAPRSGLFARLTLGGDYASVVTKSDMLPDDVTMSGLGIGLSGDIGYAPSGLFALHLRAMVISIFAPTIELADMAGQSDDVSLSSITLGFGGTVYPVPFFYATALVGISRWTLDIPYADGRATANSDFGPWVNAEIGFEGRLSDGLRLGIGARLNHATMDGGDGSELSSTGYGVFASFTVIEP